MRPFRLICALLLCALVAAPGALARTQDGRRAGVQQPAFDWPAQGIVTTPFGITGGRYHAGIDIGMLRTLNVRAAASGKVALLGTPVGFEGYGTLIGIDVGGGILTIYAHLAQASVKLGDSVKIHQPLGIAGCTGYCSGTHLHFEVRVNAKAVDPLQFLPGT